MLVKSRALFVVELPSRCNLVKLATLNLVRLGSQPKLCEDPVSISFNLFSLLHLFLFIFYFGIIDMFIFLF